MNQLQVLIGEERPHILALQEVWILGDTILASLLSLGYSVVAQSLREDGRGGVAIFADLRCLMARKITRPQGLEDKMEFCCAEFSPLQGIPVVVANWYVSPTEACRQSLTEALTIIQTSTKADVIVGDPNARHQLWCPKYEPALGNIPGIRAQQIVSFSLSAPYKVLNVEARPPTTWSGSAPDVYLARDTIPSKLKMLTTHPGSDHIPALISLEEIGSTEVMISRHPPIAYSKVGWNPVGARLEQRWKELPPMDPEGGLERSWQLFKTVILNEVKCLPRAGVVREVTRLTLPEDLAKMRSEACAPGVLWDKVTKYREALHAWLHERKRKEADRLAAEQKRDGAWVQEVWKFVQDSTATHTHGLCSLSDREKKKILSPATQASLFAKLWAEKHKRTKEETPLEAHPLPSLQEVEVSHGEWALALASLKKRQAMDVWGVKPIFWEKMPLAVTDHLRGLLSESFRTGVVPSDLRDGEGVPVLKEGKDPNEAGGYRPVTITSLLSRVAEHIVLRRIQHHMFRASRALVHKWQYGFAKGRDTVLPLLRLISDCADGLQDQTRTGSNVRGGRDERNWAQWRSLVLAVDFTDAFCRVSPTSVSKALQERGVPHYLVRWVREWMSGRTLRVFVNGTFSSRVTLDVGAPQGSILGPFLWNLVMDKLLTKLEASRSSCILAREARGGAAAFADDLTLWVTHYDLPKALEGLRLWAKRVTDFAKEEGINISEKSKMLVVTSDFKSSQGDYDSEEWGVKLGPLVVRPNKDCDAIPILGVMVDQCLTFGPHCDSLEKDLDRGSMDLKRLSSFLSPHILALIAQGWLVSKVEYGLPIWWSRLGVAHRRRMEARWTGIARSITGCIETANTKACLAEAGMRSLDVVAQRKACALAARVLALPPELDLRPLIKPRPPLEGRNIGRSAVPTVHSIFPPLPKMAGAQPVYPLQIHEPHPATVGHAFEFTAFDLDKGGLSVDNPVEEKRAFLLRKLEKYAAVTSQIFTDGSVTEPHTENGIRHPRISGSAAVFFKGDQETHIRRSSLGELACPYSCERLAITDALRSILDTPAAVQGPEHFLVVTDSLSTLTELAVGPWKSEGQCLEIWWLLARLVERGIRFTFIFCFSHCNVVRNERADTVSKEAAADSSLPIRPQWPKDILRDMSRSFAEGYDALLGEEAGIRGEFGPAKTVRLKAIPGLSRSGHRLLLQLRTGACPKLGGWRHEVDDACPQCGREVMGRQGAAIRHLFSCPATIPEELREKWGIRKSPGELWRVPAVAARYADEFISSIPP